MPIKMACDSHAKFTVRQPGENFEGSGNGLMLVGGVNSYGSPQLMADDDGSGKDINQPVAIPWKKLGYERDDVSYFSYEGVNKQYNKDAPYQDLHVSAKHMDEEIKQWKKDHPGRKLDLITHSLGGSVTALWIAEFYDPDDSAYPLLGHVIMYAPPLTGTSSATAGSILDAHDDSKQFHKVVSDIKPIIPPPGKTAMSQVVEGGELDNILSHSQTLKKVDVDVLRSSSDIVVSAGSDHIDGIREVMIDTNPMTIKTLSKQPLLSTIPALQQTIGLGTGHTDIKNDKQATSAAQHILEGTKVPCVSPFQAAGSIVKASLVHGVEVTLARGARDVSQAGDYEGVSNFVNSFN
jgi:hypothetical protein